MSKLPARKRGSKPVTVRKRKAWELECLKAMKTPHPYVILTNVQHDNWCGIYEGADCDCRPDRILLRAKATETENELRPLVVWENGTRHVPEEEMALGLRFARENASG